MAKNILMLLKELHQNSPAQKNMEHIYGKKAKFKKNVVGRYISQPWYELTEAKVDKQALRDLKQNKSYPEVAEDNKAYCFHWADGRGACAFEKKKDALSWLQEDHRSVVKFWYGEPKMDDQKLRVRH